jgi:hypothetical protein
VPYLNPDGTPIKIDTDYFGNKRAENALLSGPFAKPVSAKIKVW